MWDGRNKSYSNSPGDMTKMATMSKYDKNNKKTKQNNFFSRTTELIALKIGM